MRSVRTFALVLTTLVVVIALSSIPVTAQETAKTQPHISITDAEWNFNNPGFTCLDFTLSLQGLQGKTIRLSAYPYYLEGEGFIQNVSGDPDFSTTSGYITDQYLLENIALDDISWDRSAGNGAYTCFPDVFFPLGTPNSTYQWALLIEISSEKSGKVLASYDTQVEGLPPVNFSTPAQTARTSNINYIFDTVYNGQSGMFVRFTLETLGFEEQTIHVVMYLRDTQTGAYIPSALPEFADIEGDFFLLESVSPPYEHTLWADWLAQEGEPSSDFEFFVPYDAIPEGFQNWVPVIVLLDDQNTLLHQNIGGESDEVRFIK